MAIPLNKGRGITPGYTACDREEECCDAIRSTKAEVSPPATPSHGGGDQPGGKALNKGRGITPGYTSRICIHGQRLDGRSTKAEVSPPATHLNIVILSNVILPLNKGRGITPGYTLEGPAGAGKSHVAQQRPRYHPRLHPEDVAQRYKMHPVAQQRPRYHPRLH